MARTKADAARKAGGKAPRKIQAISNSISKAKSGKSNQRKSGGNSYCPRPTPEWQVPITEFFEKKHDENACGSNQVEDVTDSNVFDDSASGGDSTV
ncbi:hypothetical protein NPIL_588011 [Nephila pilipes]|uniref:PCNA-associated factor n=1 Tax=Nephila pilipes TaxID=299642 RepID=A0A8X6NBG3_NEPPI|nr:hypothetical protein NPIL_588011 [Nephila pilipes]